MCPKSSRNMPVFFWDEQGRVRKGWTKGFLSSGGWLELELVRGIREGCSGKEEVPIARVMPVLSGAKWSERGCSTSCLQNILDRIMARDPLSLLMGCLEDALRRTGVDSPPFPRDPSFWHRWEWMQTMALRHSARNGEPVHFSVVEREFASLAVGELDRRYRKDKTEPMVEGKNEVNRVSVRRGEYTGQLPRLASLEAGKQMGSLSIASLAEMVSRLVERAERNLRRRMTGEQVDPLFLFHEDDFVSAYPGEVDRNDLVSWLKERSVRPGEWKGRSLESLHREHPVRMRPFIQWGEGLFTWPLAGGAGRHAWDWLLLPEMNSKRDVVVRGERGKEAVRDRAISLFQESFPDAAVYQTVRWQNDTGDKGILDAIIRVPPFLFALRTEETVEPEAAKMDTVRDGMRELVRLRRAWENSFSVELKTKNGMVEREERLVEMVVTREPVVAETVAGEWRGSPPVYSLSELQNLFFILDGSVRKADYLWKRCCSNITGEEWQRLASYWLTGFLDRRESGAEKKRKKEGLEPFLPYLERAWAGKRMPAIEESLTHWWNAMLRKLEQSDAPEALWIGTHLVNVDLGTQNRFERQMKRLKQEIRKGIHHPDPVVMSESYRLVGAVVDPAEERKTPIHLRHKGLRKRLMGAGDPWVLILFYRDAYRYPYSGIQRLQL
ncbi:hypothetical protein [Desmospora profundinema]|uniref:Uncharacterized protein n=1 Tax=Desmospora profundinema TaxID=1571184 RepID=A0ABU1IPA3_9BACL|nr:hypothetical protein [Desmospora profundinema]MDR6225779.1 hypothetical protein [Desmospora profundinema]